MTKEHLKEALQSLACVFTDDQVRWLYVKEIVDNRELTNSFLSRSLRSLASTTRNAKVRITTFNH